MDGGQSYWCCLSSSLITKTREKPTWLIWYNKGTHCGVSMSQVHKTISSSRLVIVLCSFYCSVSFYYCYCLQCWGSNLEPLHPRQLLQCRTTSPPIVSIFIFFWWQGQSVYLRLASSLQSPSLNPQSAGIIGIHQMNSCSTFSFGLLPFLSVHLQMI